MIEFAVVVFVASVVGAIVATVSLIVTRRIEADDARVRAEVRAMLPPVERDEAVA